MKKIVYVTGCLGFMAPYFIKKCLSRGWYVIGVDKISDVSDIKKLNDFQQYNKRFKFIKSDINNLSSLYECDIIVNFAASSHVDNSIMNSAIFLYDNINGVHHLLELIRNKPEGHGINRPLFIQISTDEVYADIKEGSHKETNLLKPSNPYSASKASADMLILAWARTYNIKYNIIRPTNNYGIGQYPEKLIPKCIKYFKIGKQIPLHNRGEPVRNWLHADDTANAIIKVIDSGNMNEIYNISGNIELKNIEVVSKIINYMFNSNDIEKYCNFNYIRSGQDLRYSLNDDKLKSLGWSTLKKFDTELPNIINFYKKKFIW